MITRSTCAWFLCWPRHWWHTLISERIVPHDYFELDCPPVFHQAFLHQDPYPVTYCEQVTRDQYQSQSQFGSQSALWDLLEAILTDTKMTDKQKRKKLSKFKEGYPDMWRWAYLLFWSPSQKWTLFFRRRFPSPDLEPCLKEKMSSTFPSLSRLRNAIRM